MALIDGVVVGWVCTRIHPEDSMGEVYVIMEHSQNRAMDAGMTMMMVETGGDPGHVSARAVYEAGGYQR